MAKRRTPSPQHGILTADAMFTPLREHGLKVIMLTYIKYFENVPVAIADLLDATMGGSLSPPAQNAFVRVLSEATSGTVSGAM